MSLLSKTKDLFRSSEKKAGSAKKTQPSREASAGAARGEQEQQKTVSAVASAAAIRIGLTPLMTEKGMGVAQHQMAVFRVRQGATKGEIARAIQEQYQVKPLKIRTVYMRGKRRMRGRTVGLTTQWKKAYVKVEDVQKLHVTP